MTEAKYSNKEIETMSDFHKKKHRDTCCIAPKIKYHEDKFVFSPVSDDTETSNIKTFITECKNCEKVEFFNIAPVRL
ncbi:MULTISPECIES: hypothetical protein [Staphylococcus]|uniref:hypothetical protein n=1 Tax=Staphylococcus TaxID=1279 RepID=UPI00024E1AFB|nr:MULTISPECIES: hypothetical protein [Staphylococcus]EHR88166.1 hypothetical protein SEVCU122_2014 [Staphylococcus hominis VCU122]MCC3712137.1 hypothetical protein [Staphylococcus hominis]MCC3714430.1 hypothetical protein [Staphylococcus hominis]MCC3738021.1 hypothetical protein [Staphylococcus hominis]MCI2861233.1 hypothetical protein [Staphylococcus hominis]